MKETGRIDLHMHTTVSDGTDTPTEIIAKIREAGIGIFSITDHDAIKGCKEAAEAIRGSGLKFITGAEFNGRDEDGKYHILGYGMDPDSKSVKDMIELVHALRMKKLSARLDFIANEYGFSFPTEAVNELMALDNPGKPHIANMMVKFGYAKTKEIAISEYINKLHLHSEYVRPETAIEAIIAGGGIPVLAHPSYGSGDELIIGDELDSRIRKLMFYGLAGVEAFYSGFSHVLRNEVLNFAQKYDLYVTAGSDYHGTNKLVALGDTSLDEVEEYPEGLKRFLDRASDLFTQV